jgi:hypothetical protein
MPPVAKWDHDFMTTHLFLLILCLLAVRTGITPDLCLIPIASIFPSSPI